MTANVRRGMAALLTMPSLRPRVSVAYADFAAQHVVVVVERHHQLVRADGVDHA